MESEFVRRGKASNTIDLAEQYLTYCDSSSYGCNGGYPFNAAAKGIKGMPLESAYPYKIGYIYSGMCSATVLYATFATSGSISYYSKKIKQTDSAIITQLLIRPLMVGVNANDWFNYYPSATTTDVTKKTLFCSSANSLGYINHAVLLVGYTTGAWLVKNSWGTGWGDKGYVWITRSATRGCGLGYYYGTFNTTI